MAQTKKELEIARLTLEEKRKLSFSNAKLYIENKDLKKKLSLQDNVIKKYGIDLEKEKSLINKKELIK